MSNKNTDRVISQVNTDVRLRCDKCGKHFNRPNKYVLFYKEQPQVVVFKWKLKYCDKCFKERVDKSFKRLPEILNQLAT